MAQHFGSLAEYNRSVPSTLQVPHGQAARSQTFYYRPKISKEECEIALRGKPLGTFIARDSSTFVGGFCVMMRLQENGSTVTRSYLLEKVDGGIHLRLTDERPYPTLYDFLHAHTLDRLVLPGRVVFPDEDWMAMLDPALASKITIEGTGAPPSKSGAPPIRPPKADSGDPPAGGPRLPRPKDSGPPRPPKTQEPPVPPKAAGPPLPPKAQEPALPPKSVMDMAPLPPKPQGPALPPKSPQDPPLPPKSSSVGQSRPTPASHSRSAPAVPTSGRPQRLDAAPSPSSRRSSAPTESDNPPEKSPVQQQRTSVPSDLEVDEVECELYYFGCMDTWADSHIECIFQTYLELVEIRNVVPNKVVFKMSGQSIHIEDKGDKSAKQFIRRHYPIRTILLFDLDPDQRTCKVKKEKKPLSVFGMVIRKPGQDKNLCHLFAAQHVATSGVIDAVQAAMELFSGSS